MNRVQRVLATTSATLCAMGATFPGQAAEGDGWDWVVAPYIWAPSTSVDLRTGEPPAETDTSFPNLMDKIDGAFLIHAEGQGERFGMFADYIFLGLSDDKQFTRVRTQADLDSQLFELAAVWNPSDGRYRGFDLFAGLRYVDIDLDVQFDPANPIFPRAQRKIEKSYADFMLGGRYTWDWSDRWGLTLRGDVSFGETEGTWSASAIAKYRVKYGQWMFGYRHLSIEVETRNTNSELTLSGPVVGFGFTF